MPPFGLNGQRGRVKLDYLLDCQLYHYLFSLQLQIHRISAQNASHGRSHCDNHFQDHIPYGFLHCHNLPPFCSLMCCVTLCSSVFSACAVDSPESLNLLQSLNSLNSFATSKHGHCLIHSSGSISPFPFKSGERSRCPHTRQPGNLSCNCPTSSRSVERCAGVRVSAGRPRQSRPPS